MNLFRFITALVLAALYQFWKQAQGLWTALATYRDKSQRVPEELRMRRMAACVQCPIFLHTLQTCGSPLAKDPTKGCHCSMLLKAAIPENCWAYDAGYSTFGWSRDLNSFPKD